MAKDQDRDQNRDRNRDQNRSKDENPPRDRTIGEGMDSPDSTQMPLKASTGEPDWETQSDRNAGGKMGGKMGGKTGGSTGGSGNMGGDGNTGGGTKR